jgi:hypothetical protein
MRWSKGINTASSGSGRVDDIEGHLQGEIRGPTKLVKMRGAMRWTGGPKVENTGLRSIQWSPRKRCDIDNAKRWAQPERREDRVNHFVPRT